MTKDIEREALIAEIEQFKAEAMKWDFWQAAKAHEAEKLKGCVVVPSNSVNLTCEQLLTVLQYGAPDLQIERTEYSEEQMDTEMSIVWLEDGHSGKGYYAYYTELPEEGSINLDLMEEAARGGNE
ncbi:hypothetical protein [Acinetobacter haemolyticus]|uniref:hypothetical protein n=1 Tax=Acinetobacter haemolyticus TaxID=29430 RepID=UPI003F54BC43